MNEEQRSQIDALIERATAAAEIIELPVPTFEIYRKIVKQHCETDTEGEQAEARRAAALHISPSL
jgi:hypothetical protein